MPQYKTPLQTLNKSHISSVLHLIFLILLFFLLVFNQADSKEISEHKNSIEAIVMPQTPNIGDTVVLKVKKVKDKDEPPKIFFDKSKIPAFPISDSYYRSLIPLSASYKPKTYSIEIYYLGKSKKIDLNVQDTKYPVENLTLTNAVAALRASRIEKNLVFRALSTASYEKLWSGQFIFPSESKRSTSYGVKRRINGTFDPDYFHKGLDFAAPANSDVRAPEKGKVILAGLQSIGFVVNGNCIFLDHGHGVVSGYLHLNKLLVKEGAIVNKGQVIGKVGSTGIASGPHLHWGIYVLGMTVDPMGWTSMLIE